MPDEALTRMPIAKRMTLPFVRGDSIEILLTVKSKKTRRAIPLNGLSGRATIRRAFDNPIMWTLTVDVNQALTGEGTGEVTVSANGEATRQFPDHGVWDLELSDGTLDGTFRKTLVVGPIADQRDVTL